MLVNLSQPSPYDGPVTSQHMTCTPLGQHFGEFHICLPYLFALPWQSSIETFIRCSRSFFNEILQQNSGSVVDIV